MNVSKIVLRLSTLLFYGFGVWALVDPESMINLLGVQLPVAAARIEARAFYGGLEVGFGTFLWWCSSRPGHRATAHLAALSIFAGCCLVRVSGMVLEGYADVLMILSALGEGGGAVMNGWAYRRDTEQPPR